MAKNIIISINAKSGAVITTPRLLGINNENLAGELIVEFYNGEFVDGTAQLEIMREADKGIIDMAKDAATKTYRLPIKSSLLSVVGKIAMQVKITSAVVGTETPIFKSQEFALEVKEAINATETLPDDYPTWQNTVNSQLADLYANKLNKTAVKQDLGTSETDTMSQKSITNNLATKSNKNYLINSNFAINQRGKTSYAATDKYTVDRWTNNGTTCTLATKGVTISVPSAYNFYGQSIEDYANFKGKTVTLTVKISALTYTTGTPSIRIYDGVSCGYKNISTVGVHSLTYTVNDNATQLNIRAIYNNSNNSSDIVATIEWAKLEIGDTATTYIPPLFAEELPKCQRYFLPIGSGAVRYINTQIQSSLIDFTIPTPQTMRKQPTLIGDTLTVYKLDLTVQNGFTFGIIAKTSSAICIRATKTAHGLTNAILGISTTVYADAEL